MSANYQLACKAAAESMVLLKNEDNILPLNKTGKLAIIGEFAKKPRFQGAGSSQVNPSKMETAFEAISKMVPNDENVLYTSGYDSTSDTVSQDLLEKAMETAGQADNVLLFVGLPAIFESEGFDRDHLEIPQQHQQLIDKVTTANPNTVLILNNGAPVIMPWCNRPKAILEAYLGGQAGGAALADILFGEVNPGGKLAETFPIRQEDIAADPYFPGHSRQVEYREGLYVGYRYFDTAEKEVQFPFGHGLSYTRFEYKYLKTSFCSNEGR